MPTEIGTVLRQLFYKGLPLLLIYFHFIKVRRRGPCSMTFPIDHINIHNTTRFRLLCFGYIGLFLILPTVHG